MQVCLRQARARLLVERSGFGAWRTANFCMSSSEGGCNESYNTRNHTLIVGRFEELLQKWGPTTPQCLDALQVELEPMIVCRVLKKVPNVRIARAFFEWAGSKRGYQHNMYTYTALLDHYGRGKNLEAMEGLMAEMGEVGCGMSIVTFASVMRWYREAKYLEGVRHVWEHMQRVGCPPNEYIYTTYIDALVKHGCHEEALAVFHQMERSDCAPKSFTYNVLLHSLVKAGELDCACEVFRKVVALHQRPNFATFTVLVTAHAKAGALDTAMDFFRKMTDAGFVPSNSLRSLLFTALTSAGRAAEASELTQTGPWTENRKPSPPRPVKLAEMLIHGGSGADKALRTLTPELPSQYLSTVFTHLSRYPDVVWRFFTWLKRQEPYEPSEYVLAKVMDILGKAGQVDMQLEILADSEAANVANSVMYNTLIHSFCTGKQTDVALQVFDNMKKHGHRPNAHTYTMLIDLLSRTRNHAQAMKMYGEMVRAECKPSVHTHTVIIHSLVRSGKLNAANTLFERLPSPSAVTYTVLIQAFLRAKDVGRALELYEAMRLDGIPASSVTRRVLARGLQAAGFHGKAELLSLEQRSSPCDEISTIL